MKIIEFYNNYHFGDCLFFIHYCNKLIQLNCSIEIIFYCNQDYHNELKEWIFYKDKIHLLPIEGKSKSAIDCWVNKFQDHDIEVKTEKCYDKMYVRFYDKLSKEINEENPINIHNFLFDNLDILKINYDKFPKLFANYLILNSKGNSGQWQHTEEDYNILLSQNKVIITTEKTKYSEILCTKDYNLSLMDIAKISLFISNIYGVHSAPHVAMLHRWNKNKNIVFFHNLGFIYQNLNTKVITTSKEIQTLK